ncbi:helix-turn-helix transcriptional regulator [Ornithinimicrobium sufpigmenti]|uniref:helix-turn-helix transcriptional regulator n=1 Tax=Ornithinimicrobium sufpigmenti TaxID=2508882 RepID=UPI0010364C03|nr:MULTISPECIES: helix-turn-helix transcriptional regulator [unclassified Ornithinimicrobium]
MSWWDYVERVANTTRQRDIQDRTGIDASNFSRWKTGQTPRPALVAQFARAYGRPVLEAFVAAEFLTPEEAAERPAAAPSLSTLTDDQLLAEVRARMSEGRDGHGQQPAPIGDYDDPGGLVAQLHDLEDEARQRAAARNADMPADLAARRTGRKSRQQQLREQQDQDGES